MQKNNLPLADLTDMIKKVLPFYEESIPGLTFGRVNKLKKTPDKNNFARTVVPVSFEEKHFADMYAIVFRPGDGSGDEDKNLIIAPQYTNHAISRGAVTPRDKTGTVVEGIFPLCAISKEDYVIPFAMRLEQLTISNGMVIPYGTLGQQYGEFKAALASKEQEIGQVYRTVGKGKSGVRIGDPHAIYNGTDIVQVVGFLATKDETHPFVEIAKHLPKARVTNR